MIIWKSMDDPKLKEIMKQRRAIVFRFGSHITTVFAPVDDVWHSTYDNRSIDFHGAAKPTAWCEIGEIDGM